MSTGLPTLAWGGRNSRSRAWASAERTGTSSPSASQASAQRIAGPPALVRIPIRRPAGSGWPASSEAASNISSRVSVRTTPDCRNSASTVRSEAASSAPVWDEVARAPARVRPLFTATIGLARPTRRAIRENLRGFPNDSR